MISIPFTKLEGAQNDFIVIDNRTHWFPSEHMKVVTPLLCHRRKGIGSDGVIFIEPNDSRDFTMLFFNPDGSDGSMCGNGGRCAVLFARDRKIAGDKMQFDVLGQTYSGEMIGNKIRLFFPEPKKLKFRFKLKIFDQLVTTHYVHVGAPHALIFIDDIERPRETNLDEIDIAHWGRDVREHNDFKPEGVNANFLTIDEDHVVHIRTFEKGVEAETESCGTGTVAAAITTYAIKSVQPPIRVLTHGGDLLTVGFDVENQHLRNLYLEGTAREVFTGTVVYDPVKKQIISIYHDE